MARTIVEIQNQMIVELQNSVIGNILNSTSQVAIWRQMIYCVAVGIHLNEVLWDNFKIDLQKIADESPQGTPQWLQRQILNFQFGDAVSIVDGKTGYNTISPNKRVVTRCAIKQNDDERVVYVKVAKGVDTLSPLTSEELDALKSYINKIKFAGSRIQTISANADRLMVNADIFYDGQYTESVVKANIIKAINKYFSEIPYNGIIQNIKIVDAIQNVEGVTDVVLNVVKGRADHVALNSAGIVNRIYDTFSGHVIAEDATGATLEDTIKMNIA
jgi:hypothetical protein